MFDIFKKKQKVFEFDDVSLMFFEEVVRILPNKYSYLSNQLTKDFILGWKPNVLGYSFSYTFLLNSNLEKVFEKKNFPQYFIIKNIGIWELNLKKYVDVELDILTGFLGGFKSESIDFTKFDFTNFDLSRLAEKHFNHHDKDELLKIIGNVNEEMSENINIVDTFKIELPEGIFYTIKNLGNGNYLAVAKNGKVYKLTYDPYCITEIAKSVNDL